MGNALPRDMSKNDRVGDVGNAVDHAAMALDEKGKKAVAAVIDEYCFERIFSNSLATSC